MEIGRIEIARERRQTYRMLWQERPDGGARLIRLYGEMGQVVLPFEIEGHPLLEIAPYCFAGGKQPLLNEPFFETVIGGGSPAFLQELCGNALLLAELPPCVQKIGNLAFYHCKNLQTLRLGAALVDIGGDAFMNTLSLREIAICGDPSEKSGIRSILSQISSEIEISFFAGKERLAKLCYPEYYESYDEIAPAHLFGRSIHGEGFRARQCIRDGKIDFAGYDAVFLQACVDETEETLTKMAVNRLRYPYALAETSREMYQAYLREHAEGFAVRLTKQKDLELLLFLCQEKFLSAQALAVCIETAADGGWTEGAASLLEQSARLREKNSRYAFEEF